MLRAQLDGAEARRTYSLLNPPGEWPLRIAARIHEKGLMSRFLGEQIKVGDEIDVFPPNGSLTPRSSAKNAGKIHTYVGFASGCGITPVLCVIRALLETDATNRCILFYGNSKHGACHVPGGRVGAEGPVYRSTRFAFCHEPGAGRVELYNGRVDAARACGSLREGCSSPSRFPKSISFAVLGDMIEQVTAAALRGAQRQCRTNTWRGTSLWRRLAQIVLTQPLAVLWQ